MKQRYKFRVFVNGAYTYFDFNLLNDESRAFYKNEIENNKVEQITGLQDKNGKDIWEGDIVKTTPIMDDKDYFVKVYHNGISFISNGALNEFQARHSEVVGNINQNKELLRNETY